MLFSYFALLNSQHRLRPRPPLLLLVRVANYCHSDFMRPLLFLLILLYSCACLFHAYCIDHSTFLVDVATRIEAALTRHTEAILSAIRSGSSSTSFQTPVDGNAQPIAIAQAWPVPSGARRTSEDYVRLWKRKLRNSEYSLHVSRLQHTGNCYIRYHGSSRNMHTFNMQDTNEVKALYLVFRLHCNDDMEVFLRTYHNHVGSIDINAITPL